MKQDDKRILQHYLCYFVQPILKKIILYPRFEELLHFHRHITKSLNNNRLLKYFDADFERYFSHSE